MAQTQTNLISQNYDFFGPFMRAAIITDPSNPKETRVPLWMNVGNLGDYGTLKPFTLTGYNGGGDKAPTTSNISSLAFVSSITIETNLSAVPKITASLTPPYLDARKFIDSTLMDWGNSEIEVQIGYVGSKDGTILSPLYKGKLMKPDVSFGTDITIGLTAQGSGGFFLATRGVAGVTQPNQTRQQQIEAFCKDAGVEANSNNWKLTDRSRTLLQQQEQRAYANLVALDAIYEIARTCGCYMDVTGNGVQLISYDALTLEEPVATFQLYDHAYDGQLGPSNGTYPILSVSSTSAAIFLGASTKKLILTKIDKEKKDAEEAAKPPDKNGPAAGPKKATGGVRKDQDGGQKVEARGAASNTPIDAVEQAGREAIAKYSQAGYVLEIETLGVPDILPGTKVNVLGVSARIDAHYMVMAVKHEISGSGFKSSLTLHGSFSGISLQLNKTYNAAVLDASVPPNPPAAPVPPVNNGSGSGGQTTRTAKKGGKK